MKLIMIKMEFWVKNRLNINEDTKIFKRHLSKKWEAYQFSRNVKQQLRSRAEVKTDVCNACPRCLGLTNLKCFLRRKYPSRFVQSGLLRLVRIFTLVY